VCKELHSSPSSHSDHNAALLPVRGLSALDSWVWWGGKLRSELERSGVPPMGTLHTARHATLHKGDMSKLCSAYMALWHLCAAPVVV
jgi:hypothetical protein